MANKQNYDNITVHQGGNTKRLEMQMEQAVQLLYFIAHKMAESDEELVTFLKDLDEATRH